MPLGIFYLPLVEKYALRDILPPFGRKLPIKPVKSS